MSSFILFTLTNQINFVTFEGGNTGGCPVWINKHLQCIIMSGANSFASREPSHPGTINIRVPVPEVLRQRCNRSLVLLLVQYIIYVSALIMTLIALGLLAHGQNILDSVPSVSGVNTNLCFLYIRVTADTTSPFENGNRPSCIVSLLFASIATVYLIILAVLGLVKLILNVK